MCVCVCVCVYVKVMGFPDFPFDEDLASFMGHEDVRRYLVSYAKHFDLLPFIKASVMSIGRSRIFYREPGRAKRAGIEGVWAYGRMKFVS